MSWKDLANKLFPQGYNIAESEDFLSGSALVDGQTITVIGSTHHAFIGVEIALKLAGAVLETIKQFPKRPILILIDTQGQRLRHRDEMLGINRFMAHLGKCVDYARRQGHIVIGLVYEEALSGGFISTGLMADACFALPNASIHVMGLSSMARIIKVKKEVLEKLAKDHPVFAPGAENYVRMGAIDEIWSGDLKEKLERALSIKYESKDQRSYLGLKRGGREFAYKVLERIIEKKDGI